MTNEDLTEAECAVSEYSESEDPHNGGLDFEDFLPDDEAHL